MLGLLFIPDKMDQFVRTLIDEKKILFASGNFLVFGFPNNLITLTNLTTFFHVLYSEYPDSVDLIRELGVRQIKAMARVILPEARIPFKQHEIDLLLNCLPVFGYGNIRFVSIQNTSKVVFQIEDSPFCLAYNKLFGVQKKGVNAFVVGLCEGLAELRLGLEMKAIENQCLTEGKAPCYITATATDKKEYDEVLINYTDALLSDQNNEIKGSSADLIRKVMGHNMITWKDGSFSVWNVPGFIIPSMSLAFLHEGLAHRYGDKAVHLLYHLARIQSRAAVEYQVNNFGFAKDEKLLRSVVEHSELTGFGVSELEEVDFADKKILMKHLHNPFSLCMRKITDSTEASDLYVSGLIAGTAEGFFDCAMVAKETKCAAKGDAFCFHEVLEGTGYPISSKALAIMEEKITPKNFTS